MKTWEQQSWHDRTYGNGTVSIAEGYVFLDGGIVNKPREVALGNIILRLNSQVIHFQELVKELQKKLEESKSGVGVKG